MCFPSANESQEDDVGFIGDELESKEVLDLDAVDFLRPVPAECVEGFDDGKTGGFDASGGDPIKTQGGFSGDESGEVIEVGLGIFSGFGGVLLALFFDERQAQFIEMIMEFGEVGVHGVLS